MNYIALLRGINVGGNNKVDMKLLKDAFEQEGFIHVRTYINSGNVLFSTKKSEIKTLQERLQQIITSHFGITVAVLVKTADEFNHIARALPDSWVNNSEMKTDVMFLWEEIDTKVIENSLPIKPNIDRIISVKGAVIWNIDRKNVTKSGITKIVGSPVYSQITVRNCNTVRKLYQMLMEIE